MTDQDNSRHDRHARVDRGGIGSGTVAMLALGGLLVIGGVIYALSDRGNQPGSTTGGTATAPSPPATTAGSGAPASSGNAERP